MEYPKKFSPYTVKNPLLFFYLKFIDFIFSFFKKNKNIPIKNKKILFVNLAHLGDVVLTASLIETVKKKYPHSKIGLLTASTNKSYAKILASVDFLHFLDHPKNNRSKKTFIFKLLQYLKTLKKSYTQIKKIKYDISIDTSIFYPNSHFFTAALSISKRVGFVHGGGKDLLTHSHVADLSSYILKEMFNLLTSCNVSSKDRKLLNPLYKKESKKQTHLKYFVFHPFSDDNSKNYPISYWSGLYQFYKAHGVTPFFIGSGEEQNKKIQEILSFENLELNLCNKTNFLELIALIKSCEGLVCVDSVSAHLAKSYRKKVFVIFTIKKFTTRWHDVLSKNLSLYSS